MEAYLKTGIWQQFGAAIDYLNDTIRACPDEIWLAPMWEHPNIQLELRTFWYRAYHTVFWLNLYLTGTEDGFLPPAPFELIEQDEFGPIPVRAYTQAEVLAYLQRGRAACKATIEALIDEKARQRCGFGWGEVSFYELLIYNLRHVQEHTAQLNLILGQKGVETPDYAVLVKY